jgi:hypothetical protein
MMEKVVPYTRIIHENKILNLSFTLRTSDTVSFFVSYSSQTRATVPTDSNFSVNSNLCLTFNLSFFFVFVHGVLIKKNIYNTE